MTKLCIQNERAPFRALPRSPFRAIHLQFCWTSHTITYNGRARKEIRLLSGALGLPGCVSFERVT